MRFSGVADAVANGGSVRAINARGCGSFSRKEIDSLSEFVKTYGAKGMAWIAVEEGGIRSSIAKFFSEEEMDALLKRTCAEPGDLVCFIADKNQVVYDSLGALRVEIAESLGILDDKEYKFLWVTEFPLFEFDEEENRWAARHHPFTSPMDEDIEFLESDPGRVRQAYDIVLNGTEIGGGSIWIHMQDLAEDVQALGLSEEEAQNWYSRRSGGAPPHGGMAYTDRLVMLMAGRSSIRTQLRSRRCERVGPYDRGA